MKNHIRAYVFLTNDGIFKRHLAKKMRALDCSLSLKGKKIQIN